MPMRAELPVAAAKMRNRPSVVDWVASWIVATIKCPEFLMIVLFCTVGLWLTFYFMHSFPDFGGGADSLEVFP